MTKRDEFIRTALTWQGVPWRKVGSRRNGVNCLGLLVGVAKECNFPMDIAAKESEANYTNSPVPGYMLKRAKEDLDIIHVRDAIPGDLLLFRFNNEPSHITIITEINPFMIIHSDTEARSVRHTPIPPGWMPCVAFRIRELQE